MELRRANRVAARALRFDADRLDRRPARGAASGVPTPALVGQLLCLRSCDHFVDHVVAEPARNEECVDLALAFGGLERLPATELTRDRPARAVRLAFGGHLPESRVDRFPGDPFARELAHEGAVALRAET